MGNIVSYLKWRGDISLRERPFCDVDNLILSELADLDFTGIVPSPLGGGSILVSDAAEQLEQHGKAGGIMDFPADFVSAFVRSKRFRTAELSNFDGRPDEIQGWRSFQRRQPCRLRRNLLSEGCF